MKKYIVYLTTNKVNNKIYVGVHGTDDPNTFDGYLGCGVFVNSPKTYKNGGTIFQRAVLKYGVRNFNRKTIAIFNTIEEALKFESEIVNDDFIKRTDTYNMVVGGGMPPDLSKTVYQFDLDGNLINEWKNQVEVVNHYGCYTDMIYNCIKDKRSFRDSYWSNENKLENLDEYRLSRTKCIYQYNLKGKLLNVFDNIRDTSIKLDIDEKRIINALASRLNVDDCYFITADTNIEDVIEYRKNKNNNKKKVYRYNLDGTYDCEFESLSEAAKNSGLKKGHSISTAIKNFKISGGYKWSYLKTPVYTEVKLVPDKKESQKVGVYDEKGELIESFETASECVKKYKYCRRVLRGERKKAHNLFFKYIS